MKFSPRGTEGLPCGSPSSIASRRLGSSDNHKESYIDCTVQFSEEERAIIQARDLYREGYYRQDLDPAAERRVDPRHRSDARSSGRS